MKIITLFFYLIIQTWCVQASQISADTNAASNESISAQNISFDDLTIVVFSCDKYQELWAPFFEMFFKSWPSLKTTNSQVPIYLVTNALKHDDPRIISINNQNEKSWSDNALAVLAAVKTKYVLILLEDYFFTRLDEKRLSDIFNFMKSQDVAYCQIACGTDMETRYKAEVYPGVAEKDRYELWRTSLNACFWRTKDMAHTLKSGENIWAFEIAGSVRSQGLYGKFLTVFKDLPADYLNMVQQGYVNSDNLKKIQEMGITYKRAKLDLDSEHRIKLYLYYQVLAPIKEFVKSSIQWTKSQCIAFVRKAIPSFGS